MPCKECNTAQFQDVPFTMQRNNVGKLQWTTALCPPQQIQLVCDFQKGSERSTWNIYFFNNGVGGVVHNV